MGETLRGKTTTSPSPVRSRRGSPSASRHVKGGNVISFSAGYCARRGRGSLNDLDVAMHALNNTAEWQGHDDGCVNPQNRFYP